MLLAFLRSLCLGFSGTQTWVGERGENRKERVPAFTPTSSSFLLPPTPVLQGPLPSLWTRKKGRMGYKLLARGHSNLPASHSSHFRCHPFPWAKSFPFHRCYTLTLQKHPTQSTYPQQHKEHLLCSSYHELFLEPAGGRYLRVGSSVFVRTCIAVWGRWGVSEPGLKIPQVWIEFPHPSHHLGCSWINWLKLLNWVPVCKNEDLS